MSKEMYFIIDVSHEDFDTAVEQAAFAQSQYVSPNSSLSIQYSLNGLKAVVKVIGGSDDWYELSQWKDHPAILGIYSRTDPNYSDHNDLRILISSSEWSPNTVDEEGSPQNV